MQFFFIVYFCLLLTIVNGEVVNKDDIKYLSFNDTNYYGQYLHKYENILLYFTANWSDDSHSKKQNFLNIKNDELTHMILAQKKSNYLIIGEVDSKSYKICHEYDIQKYPSIVLVEGSKYIKYKGDFETESILHWLKQ